MTAQSPFIEIHSVSRVFNGGNGVHDLSIDIPRGSFVVLLGPSGCGKSTTLRLIAGLETADQGLIRIDGKDVTNTPPSKRGLSMVFQSYALFPHLSVAENIIFGLKVRKTDKGEIKTRLAEALSVTGLEGCEDRKPSELSGGQRFIFSPQPPLPPDLSAARRWHFCLPRRCQMTFCQMVLPPRI